MSLRGHRALLDTIWSTAGTVCKSIDINDEGSSRRGGQIIGSESPTMSQSRDDPAINAGYDVIDLNFACPVKKIKNKARGGHMLLDAPRAVSIHESGAATRCRQSARRR